MNSLHLLASTVDKAFLVNKDASSQSVDDNDLVDTIDDAIVTRVDPQDMSNSVITNEEDDQFYQDDYVVDEQQQKAQQLDDESNKMIWKFLYIIFFLPNVLIYKPICFIISIITYPFRVTMAYVFQKELEDQLHEDSELDNDTINSLNNGVSTAVDVVGRHENKMIPTISEEDDDDLEFEIGSDAAILADKLKSPTSQRSTLEEEEQQQQQQLQQQKKKTKKKKQRFVFPRLLINNCFDLHNPPAYIKKKTLILDLDETLIHSLSRHNSSVFSKSKGKMIEIKLNNQLATLYYIYKRPYVDEFFNIVKNWFDLVCFTASIKEYADPVINFLEEDFVNNIGTKAFEKNSGGRLFQRRYYRNDCIWEKGVGYIKDLSILTGEFDSQPGNDTPTKSNNRGRDKDDGSESESASISNSVKSSPDGKAANKGSFIDPSKLIIIDNSPVSYSMNKENGIMIEGWINDPNDLELMNLLPLLNSLRFTSDVRAVLSLKDGEASFNEI